MLKEIPSINIFQRLFSYLQPHKKLFFISLFSMVIYGATDGVLPFLIRSLMDDVFGSSNRDVLDILPFLILAYALLRSGSGFLQRYLMAIVGHRIVRDIRNEISAKLLLLSDSFFSKQTTGELLSRMTNDTLLIRSALTDAAASLLRDGVRVIALISVAFYLDPILALAAFFGLPLALFPVIKVGKKVRKLSKVGQDQLGGLTSVLQESILGHRVVKAFSGESAEQKKFSNENEKMTGIFLKAEKYASLSSPLNEFVASIIICLIVVYGGFTVIGGTRTQGEFFAFLATLFLLYEPIKKFARVNNVIQAGVAAFERVSEIIDLQPEIKDKVGAVKLTSRSPRVEFRDVSFSYNKDSSKDVPALKNINLAIEPKNKLALVGMSGGGKSTMANLLLRFWDPSFGKVLIDGRDIREFTVSSLRENIAYVSQEAFLFYDTVYNNILYGRPQASEKEVLAAAQAAGVEAFVSSLDNGYNTMVGERGLSLSGGQRARVAIARAFLKNAPILILDEATAALDSESEEVVQDAIQRLMKDKTVLVIAHRLATVCNADSIAVVVGGKIIERGRHKELLEIGGEYAKLCAIQFAASRDGNQEVRAKLRIHDR